MSVSNTDELLSQAMLELANYSPMTIFIGQGVEYGGVATFKHLKYVPAAQRREFPVAEELQLGVSLGLSIVGYLPVSIFPRIDFLLRAADQLVNHLDKLEQMTVGRYRPKVIIRTRVGSRTPLDAGPQHTQDHTYALSQMLTSVRVTRIVRPESILAAYRNAMIQPHSSLIVEALD